MAQILACRSYSPPEGTQAGLPVSGARLVSQGCSPAPGKAKKAPHILLEASLWAAHHRRCRISVSRPKFQNQNQSQSQSRAEGPGVRAAAGRESDLPPAQWPCHLHSLTPAPQLAARS